MVFPVVMYGCESWTIKKAECRRIHAFELRCWKRLLRVPWAARRSNQSILNMSSYEYSLETEICSAVSNSLRPSDYSPPGFSVYGILYARILEGVQDLKGRLTADLCWVQGRTVERYRQTGNFSSSHVQMWELDHKEGWMPKNWCFWTGVLEKTLESPLDCKEIQPVHPKGDQSWVFIGRTDAEVTIFWPPDAKSQLIG